MPQDGNHLFDISFIVFLLLVGHVEAKLQDDEVVGVCFVEGFQMFLRHACQRGTATAAQREIVDRNAATSFERHTIAGGASAKGESNLANTIGLGSHCAQTTVGNHREGAIRTIIDFHGNGSAAVFQEERGHFEGVETGIVFHTAIFDKSASTALGIPLTDAQRSHVKPLFLQHVVFHPSSGRMLDGGPQFGEGGIGVNKPNTTATEAFLKQLAKVGRQDVALDKGIAEIGDAHRAAQTFSFRKGLIKPVHAMRLSCGIVLYASHALRTRFGLGIQECRFGNGRGRLQRGGRRVHGKEVGEEIHRLHFIVANGNNRKGPHKNQGDERRCQEGANAPRPLIIFLVHFFPNVFCIPRFVRCRFSARKVTKNERTTIYPSIILNTFAPHIPSFCQMQLPVFGNHTSLTEGVKTLEKGGLQAVCSLTETRGLLKCFCRKDEIL